MIMVMMIMGLVVALSLTLLMSASHLLTIAYGSNEKEQCRLTAVSVSRTLVDYIESFSYQSSPVKNPSHPNSDLEDKLLTVGIGSWDAGMEEALTYDLKDVSDNLPGSTTLQMYWIDSAGDPDGLKYCLDADEEEEGAEEYIDMEIAAELFQNVRLYLVVTNTVDEDSSTVITILQPIVYTAEVTVESDEIDEETGEPEPEPYIVWTHWNWEYSGQSWEGGEAS